MKRKLAKVNRALGARLLEEEEELNENKGADDADAQKHQMLRKHQRKKKGLTSEVLNDERFTAMFENKVFHRGSVYAKNLLFLIAADSYDQPSSTLFPGICEIVGTLITSG
ncbi:UNVERIFIED_CONTAM: hypothetical protein Sindi_1990000, partial [Sesamum indicum]